MDERRKQLLAKVFVHIGLGAVIHFKKQILCIAVLKNIFQLQMISINKQRWQIAPDINEVFFPRIAAAGVVYVIGIKRQKINIPRFRVIGGAVDLKSPRAFCDEFKHGHIRFLASLII